ncbi:hypothetical protein FRC12_021420 [Ceratobasidium sp. 428]|nr:hypothetical protein FRC12_021420 [Ceratobasidium sp. 428]
MSRLDRGDPGSSGLPFTSKSPLLGDGLSLSGLVGTSAEVSAALSSNAVIANLSYADKLRIIGGFLSQSAYNNQHFLSIYVVSEDASTTKIRDHLNLTYKLSITSYAPSPGTAFNATWFKRLGSGLAIVPPSVLLLALSQGLLGLLDISCLIIDDAYSVVLDDLSTPLMTILLEYYGPLITSDRPRILGLTRYPLNLDANFGYAALRMEQLLDARVYGQLDDRRAAIKRAVDRATVSVLDYPASRPQVNLTTPPVGQYHVAARATLYEIGACSYPLLAYFSVDSVLESMTPNNMFSGLPAPNCFSGTTPKLDKFLQFIQMASQIRDYKCIVIGSNPFTALSLGWILSAHQRPGIRSSVYLGQLGQEGGTSVQHKTLDMFKAGSINTLVCTDAILSDIDGGICSHVLWFNSHSSLIAFAHSRLLARHKNSNIVIMAEHANREHYRAIRDILHTDTLVLDWIHNMNVDGAPIPPSSLAHCPRFGGTPVILTPSRPEGKESLYIMNPVSGSRIYPKDATEVLYRYLASQPTSDNTLASTRVFKYDIVVKDKELWRCTVNLSAYSPSLQVSGALCSSRAAARASACFKSCSTLFNLDLLTSSMFPLRPVHTLTHGVLQCGPSLDNHPIASPLFWHNCILAAPSLVFYPVVVSFTTPADSKGYGSMIFLTRLPLAGVEPFSVFSSQKESQVHLQPCAPLSLSTKRAELVFQYTMHLWRSITNKPFECPSGKLAYFVCPVIANGNLKTIGLTRATSVEPFISWKEIDSLIARRVRPLNWASVDSILSELAGGVIQDRANEFTRRFEDGQLRRDLNPLSRIMTEREGAPAISLLDYYKSHRHEFEGIKDLRQPIIEAQLLPGLANRLDPQETPTEITKNFLVPEMCHISNIPATTFRTALIMPSIVWHIENLLIAKELNLTLFQGQVRDDLLMHALCSQMARRTFNYERLEFLGDTFIKYAASAYLYSTEPNATSGILHSRRQMMVSNKTLWAGAQAIGLPPCIQSEPFRPKYWTIPNTGIMARDRVQDPGDGPEYTEHMNIRVPTRSIPLKVVADVVEAIIGAALLSGGEKLAFSVAKTLGFDARKTCDWLDVVAYAPSKTQRPREAQDKEMLKGMMKIIGTTLEDPDLLLQAMHHPSLSIYSESYERLEFLGDSVLDMLVVQSFFADEEKWSPHGMTLIKSSMVSNRVLAIICVESGLHRFLLHDKPSLTQNIKSFVEEVEAGKREAQTDSQRTKHWSNLRAPKELGDVVEALLGAIYVSSGFRLLRVKAVYNRLLRPFYDRYIDKKAMLSHPMTTLMKRLESIGCKGVGVSKTIVPSKAGKGEATRCEVKIHGQVLSQATAEKTKRAVTLAAEEGNLQLDLKFDDITRGCTCKGTVQGKKRKRVPTEGSNPAEVDDLPQSDDTLGDDAEHPIDVDMFDF